MRHATAIAKYPRTRHIAGSRLQPGDADLAQVPFSALAGRARVVEEKLDGANVSVSFDADGDLVLQSRGHALAGGPRERQFDRLKTWAAVHRNALEGALSDRYVMYGEWLYAKHTVYCNALPHWPLEFDVLDRRCGELLDTDGRRALLRGLPIRSVPVVHRGPMRDARGLRDMIGSSLYRTAAWRQRLRDQAATRELDVELVLRQTDPDDAAEGLYIKHERDGRVVGRYKLIRASFLQSVPDSETCWMDRPIAPNALAPGIDVLEVQSSSSDRGPA
jgi:hypothetical protein